MPHEMLGMFTKVYFTEYEHILHDTDISGFCQTVNKELNHLSAQKGKNLRHHLEK